MAVNQKYNGEFQEGPAARSIISLSQLISGPLESLLKAQTHAARSFLNMILQLGYPHIPIDDEGNQTKAVTDDEQRLYLQEFKIETTGADGKPQTSVLKVPALALVPLAPLSIDEADFQVEFRVSHVYKHQQMQESEKPALRAEGKYDEYRRPWYLVKDPISIRGVIAPKVSEEVKEDNSEESSIKINIKVTRQPMPAGIDKILTSLTQLSSKIQ